MLFLKVGTGYGLPETTVKQSFLEAYGFTVLNFNSYNVAVSPHKVHAIEGMTLYIPEDEVEDALALLESAEEDQSTITTTRVIVNLLSFWFSGFYIPSRAIGFFATPSALLKTIITERKIISPKEASPKQENKA